MNIRYLFLVTLLFSLLGCNDIVEVDSVLQSENKPSTGAPVIDKIVLASDKEIPITQANFEDVIRIEGQNLGNVISLKINDIEVDAKEIYSSYDKILAPIPRELPQEVTNTVYVTTELGTASVPLIISLPNLVIDGLYNEFAQPGDTTTISGDDFDLYGITAESADIRFGDVPVNILESSRTSVTIQIPANAQPGSRISIQGDKMSEPAYISYADPGVSQLFNFNNWPGEGAFTHASQFPDAPTNFLYDASTVELIDGAPEMISPDMKYIRFNGDVGAWGWMVMWAGYINIPAEVAANPSEYDIRFELNTSSVYPLNSFARIMVGNFGWYPASSGVPINTQGKWMTMRIPANSLDKEGNQLIPEGCDPATKFAFTIVFSPESEQTFDVSFCNFRFVKRN